jgi:RNase adapter protein RapZ
MNPMSVLGLGRRRADNDETEGTARLTDLVLITGYSGAGKSSAMQFFEDAGYFCVDNLPPGMIRSLAELFMHEGSKVERAAVVSDARGGEYFESLVDVAEQLRGAGVSLRILFLEADEQTLITRYKETRRRHPLANSGSVVEGIAAERPLVAPLRERADFVLDTSGLRPSHLRHRLAEEMLPARSPSRLALTFNSFGHKHGPLRDADLVLDVRFLPNPHYDAKLRPLTGLDQRIVAYVNRDGELEAFYDRLFPLLDYLLPQYVREGKAHLVVGIGCTGGRHRSVVIAEALARRYRDGDDYLVEVNHRDIETTPGGLAASG